MATPPRFERILHPTDLSEASDKALEYALDLAAAAGGDLHIMHVVAGETDYTATPDLPVHVEKQLREQMHEAVSRQRKSLETASQNEVHIEYALIEGVKPAETIIRYAKSRGMDLIVPGTHARRGMRRLLLGSVVEALVRNSPVPALVVRPRPKPSSTRFRHILAPVDFSDYSTEALRHAKQLAALFGGQVTLLFVAEERTVPLFSDTGIPNFTVLKMDDEVIHNAPAALEALDESVQVDGVETEHLVRQGRVDTIILEVAEKTDADLIVMGSHGVAGAERRLLGNTTDHIIRTAAAPVLVVPAPELQSA